MELVPLNVTNDHNLVPPINLYRVCLLPSRVDFTTGAKLNESMLARGAIMCNINLEKLTIQYTHINIHMHVCVLPIPHNTDYYKQS